MWEEERKKRAKRENECRSFVCKFEVLQVKFMFPYDIDCQQDNLQKDMLV